MAALYMAAVLAGLVLGWLVIVVWRRFLPAARAAAFWRDLMQTARLVITTEDVALMWRHYKHLLGLVAGYTTRNLLGIAVALVPVLLFLWLVAPLGLERWNAMAPFVEIHPAGVPVTVEGAAVTDVSTHGLLPAGNVAAVRLGAGADALVLRELSINHAVCAAGWRCLLLGSLAFRLHAPPPGSPDAPIIVRPSVGDGNPFWPYLNDLEFVFFLAFFVATMAGWLWSRRWR